MTGLYIILGSILIVGFIVALFAVMVIKVPPDVPDTDMMSRTVTSSGSVVHLGKNWLNRNKHGLYEMYVAGAPFERGVVNGRLTEKLIYTQEKIFISEIKAIVKNSFYLGFLKYVVAWINRKLKKYIGNEYDQEIYGVSLSASKDFRLIGPNYMRVLNYHAAHDIGHMLQDMNLVGCTSFVARGGRTENEQIIHARNFDFYVGDEFCKEKIITFYAPDKGHRFVMITWGALIGTVSGMNVKGLAITVNAAKSKLMAKTATPVTILIREMLQYASTIDEVIEIAKKRKIFVSESFLVSSGRENRALIIEKTPYQTELFDPGTEQIICTNHFQSGALKNDPINLKHIEGSASMYRYKRTAELLASHPKLSVKAAVEILRDRKGLGDVSIGNGNEKTVNQLLAHHSVVFNPVELKMWISAGEFGLGEFICYDLHEVFSRAEDFQDGDTIIKEDLAIVHDNFLDNGGFEDFERFKELKKKISDTPGNFDVSQEEIDGFTGLNPDYYLSYSVAGNFFYNKKDYVKAAGYYRTALRKEIPTVQEREEIKKKMKFCENRTPN
ncbi:MAG TPA: C45 family autoproteolytic acyltransferase/hydrolase [Bacteroidales bacterium]|nr:C45 family autoproteolytic acyltransferase/hydrolase [Bacteroidales bacterium]